MPIISSRKKGRFASQLAELNKANISLDGLGPTIETTKNMFEITVKSLNGKGEGHIRQDGEFGKSSVTCYDKRYATSHVLMSFCF